MSTYPQPEPGLTRVVIVPTGTDLPAQEFWADSWTLLPQDNGSTLKIVASGDGSHPRRKRASRLAVALGAITGAITGG
ncbi:hypothetical protein ABIE52_006818 [Rhodococcus sp. OAS809]|uniref:hypothetical protein n=1 Tax=Rhodococcus sp. OAS809 TaxID=2663874 RepID=UPI001789D5ED